MKRCSDCGLDWPDNIIQCPTCKQPTQFHSVTSDPAVRIDNSKPLSAYQESERVRPDGSAPRTIGWFLIALGVLIAAWSGLMPVTTYSFGTEIDPGKVATKALLAVCSEGAFGLGLALWLAGYIVHAISFLPGREDLNAQD